MHPALRISFTQQHADHPSKTVQHDPSVPSLLVSLLISLCSSSSAPCFCAQASALRQLRNFCNELYGNQRHDSPFSPAYRRLSAQAIGSTAYVLDPLTCSLTPFFYVHAVSERPNRSWNGRSLRGRARGRGCCPRLLGGVAPPYSGRYLQLPRLLLSGF